MDLLESLKFLIPLIQIVLSWTLTTLYMVHKRSPECSVFLLFLQQNHIIIADDEGTIEFTLKDGNKHLKATDAEGNTVFDGPVDADQQRKNYQKIFEKSSKKLILPIRILRTSKISRLTKIFSMSF